MFLCFLNQTINILRYSFQTNYFTHSYLLLINLYAFLCMYAYLHKYVWKLFLTSIPNIFRLNLRFNIYENFKIDGKSEPLCVCMCKHKHTYIHVHTYILASNYQQMHCLYLQSFSRPFLPGTPHHLSSYSIKQKHPSEETQFIHSKC